MTQIIDRKTEYATIGKRSRRQDGYDKLVGRTRYAGDLAFAGLLHARLVLSPYAHARIVNIDTSAALEVPGVKAVYTSQTLGMSNPETNSRGQSPLASKEALWCGHPVAIVLAETEAAAEDGVARSEEHTSELQSQSNLVCRLLLEKKKHILTHSQ